jgi:hypothetical protein
VNYSSDEKLQYSEKGDMWFLEIRGKKRKAAA